MSTKNNPATQLASLLRRLAGHYKPEDPPQRDPITQLVLSFLEYEASHEQAQDALGKLLDQMVDINDLRVSLPDEIIDIIGRDYPLASQRVTRMLQSLYEVYRREHAMQMHGAEKSAKKDQRYYLDTLPGMLPYVAAQVMLLSFGGHAMPIDRRLVALLAGEEIASPDIDPAQLESWMLRQIKADRGLQAHLLFQAWADDNPIDSKTLDQAKPIIAARPAGARKKKVTTRKKSSKKAAKTTASKKATTKKSAKRSKTSKKR